MEVRVSYDSEHFPSFDHAIEKAAARASDFSGMGMGLRDHGWVCSSEFEAALLVKRLRQIGLHPTIRE